MQGLFWWFVIGVNRVISIVNVYYILMVVDVDNFLGIRT